VPILQRMSSPEKRSLERGADAGATGTVRHCVVCGQRLNGSPDAEVTCPECGALFRVEFL
jgi:uncharacterized Zn finger protein (UPF0148 family)